MAEITLRAVRKTFGRTPVVHGLDLDIAHREFVVILGPSGCGKSTLLRMIAGLESITEGEIAIDGSVVNKLEPRERGCAMVFQNYALYPHMTVAENIGYALKVAGVAGPERDARVRKVATSVGLQDLLERRPGQLSGGQRQRVAMARAMVREPKVFLFDEPFSNLDAKLRVAMRAEVRRLHRDLGVTSVFVTHDQIEAMTLADRLIVMNAGVIEQVGRPGDVYGRPASRFVADFIGSPAMNLIDGEVTADGYLVHGREGRIRMVEVASKLDERKVTAGIRPEHLRRVSPDSRDSIVAIVDYVEELGASRLVHADSNGTRLVAVDNADDYPSTGETVHLAFDPANLHLFSSKDGKRLVAGAAPGSQVLAATA